MLQQMDIFDSSPKMIKVTSKDYDVAARVAEVLQAHFNYVQHGLVETTYTFTYLYESQRERSTINSRMPALTKLSHALLRRLIDFFGTKIEAHANNLREQQEIRKGEAKDLIMKLQEIYPDLDVNAATIESVAEEEDDTSPATPLRQDSTIDDSGIAEIAQSVPSKTMNGSTSATEDNIGAEPASATVADSSHAATKRTRQGFFGIFGNFFGILSRRSQSEQSNVSIREHVEEQAESDKISMREAYRNGNPSSITRKRTVSEEVFIAERAALQAKVELQEATLSAQSDTISQLSDAISQLSDTISQLSDTISQLHSQCACTVCLELAYRPHVLSPCGHVFCARCLVLWFKEALPDEPPFAPYLTEEQRLEEQQRRTLRRKKLCPHCRVRVQARPAEVWMIKGLVNKLDESIRSGQGNDKDTDISNSTSSTDAKAKEARGKNLKAGTALWDTIFPHNDD
ncbi:uncharacterized protein FA14DRAFT_181018 [Meira miltonrushii]|uniref:RING-type domain-containing protein n=1 Tax=Meira miltonrushii TaxID=1280837 RepID=A0A316VAA2_9BASI|nr:uncharacterized protein FA14DRAFT_181018 [Meira miltonrushii]PWN34392.1 hypothetical protein FA14DRAFT_181018 [Meira miltonrushii]